MFFLILTIVFFVSVSLTSTLVENRGFNNYTSDSNTLFLKENQAYDILILGISHARNFSRHKNHEKIEKLLDAKIINLGQGRGACSINEQHFYQKFFYQKNNFTDKTLLILSPPMLFSETLPLASNTFEYESFSFEFLWEYLQFHSENKTERILTYLESKLDLIWIFKKPKSKDSEDRSLEQLNMKAVVDGQNYAYNGENLNFERLDKSKKIVEDVIRLANEKNSKVYLIIPPALFGKWRGHKEVEKFASELQNKYDNVIYFDGSETIQQPQYYYDNHHLNTDGVVKFTKEHLEKVF